VYRLDATHGSLLAAYSAMGKPAYPSSQQITELHQAAQLPAPELQSLTRGRLTLVLPPHGLALIELE
jgi:xylan 1,4-beta-xylosidase